MPKPTARRRRSAEESRRRILATARKRLTEAGPEALRLQELAADLGLSHPAILHHFGSREGLLQELAADGARNLNEEIARRIGAGAVDIDEILALTAETLADQGQARLLAWLVLSGRATGPAGGRLLEELAGVAHASRAEYWAEQGLGEPSAEDTTFSVLLVALALFGEALLGDLLRESLGLEGADSGERFRAWLARLLENHLAPAAYG